MPNGDRVLTEPEWTLFRTGLSALVDYVEDDIRNGTDDAESGVPTFDQLTPEQKLALLADVAHVLRDPATPTPRHTAASEGAIAAVLSVAREELAEDDAATDAIEELEDRVFWDDDFAMGDLFLDMPPGEAKGKQQQMMIDPDYYVAAPDEPNEAGLIAARQKLARLIGWPVPGDDGLYPGLDDEYNSLTVGPCSSEEIAAWEKNPWVQEVRMTEPGWECSYQAWMERIGPSLPQTPFQLAPMTAEAVYELPTKLRAERRGKSWVIRDEDGSYWCGLVENCWSDDPDEESMPALTFPTEAEARSAYAQADQLYEDRRKRYEKARVQLGLDDE
jgi:hypothetical protein